ncbi:MAG TPA: MerR family transcriptional regulator [Candidatus Aminicenantes bacterium]|nr:MerR family transcriptional regulator [Candidatus Aminicenantes bacterium]
MDKKMLLRDEFLARLGITESELKEWQDLKLLMPDGITSENVSFFTKRSIEKAQKIKELVNIGYGFREIQRIVKKVGLPVRENSEEKSDKVNKYLTVGLLAERVGVSPRTIKHWEDKGIIESDMRSEGGFRLYSEIYTYLCKLIRDLQLFGYSLEEIKETSDLFRDFLVMEKNLERYPIEENEKKFDVMLKKIEKFYEKIDLFKNGIERWDELLTKKRKEILSLKQQNKKRKKSKGKKK